jgi:DNA processing protein
MSMTEDHEARLVLSYITEPGDEYLARWLTLGASAESILASIVEDSIAIPSEEHARFLTRVQPRLYGGTAGMVAGIVGAQLQLATQHGITFVFPDDELWPAGLNDLAAPPVMLYVRGNVDVLLDKRPAVAIVGARAATSYGEHITRELAADLAPDHVVVSGGAYGIDGAAHRAAMMAGGRTIAYLAGGADRPYPAGHAQLLREVAATGAVVSEVPVGSAPTKWRFLQRNRLIAAHSKASIVVEAGWRSGSLNEAGHARAIGRKVGAVPGAITSAASAGTHRLIRESGATLVTSADDVRELVGTPRTRAEVR